MTSGPAGRGAATLELDHRLLDGPTGPIPVLVVQDPRAAPPGASDGVRPLVVHFHGLDATKETDLLYARTLAEGGFRVALCDAPFHGERAVPVRPPLPEVLAEVLSSGAAEFRAVHAALGGGGDTPGLLSGRSLGGVRALLAAAELDPKPAACVAIGAGGDLPYLIEAGRSAALANPELTAFLGTEAGREALRRFDPIAYADALARVPVFLGAGADDVTFPAECARRLEAALVRAGGKVECFVEEGAAHTLDPRIETRARDFLVGVQGTKGRGL